MAQKQSTEKVRIFEEGKHQTTLEIKALFDKNTHAVHNDK